MKSADDNPYEAPQGRIVERKELRAQIRWWLIALWILVAFFLTALLLPALQPAKTFDERQFREWKRQLEAEQGSGIDSADGVAPYSRSLLDGSQEAAAAERYHSSRAAAASVRDPRATEFGDCLPAEAGAKTRIASRRICRPNRGNDFPESFARGDALWPKTNHSDVDDHVSL